MKSLCFVKIQVLVRNVSVISIPELVRKLEVLNSQLLFTLLASASGVTAQTAVVPS